MTMVPRFGRRHEAVVELLRARARAFEKQARADRRLAAKIVSPPEGVSVEVHASLATVTFVGPFVDLTPRNQSDRGE